jgi:hypothetical protein
MKACRERKKVREKGKLFAASITDEHGREKMFLHELHEFSLIGPELNRICGKFVSRVASR